MIHELKCDPRFWGDYKNGNKTSSMRKNDRHFSVGDIVILKLFEENRFILNEVCVRKISHITNDYDFPAIPDGYCVLSLKEV